MEEQEIITLAWYRVAIFMIKLVGNSKNLQTRWSNVDEEVPKFLQWGTTQLCLAHWTALQILICDLLSYALPANCFEIHKHTGLGFFIVRIYDAIHSIHNARFTERKYIIGCSTYASVKNLSRKQEIVWQQKSNLNLSTIVTYIYGAK